MLQELSYELVRDQLQLTGQADVFLRFCWCTTKYFRFFIAIFIAMRVNLGGGRVAHGNEGEAR